MQIQPHASLPALAADPALARELLSQLAVLKLNGGLGTSMGAVPTALPMHTIPLPLAQLAQEGGLTTYSFRRLYPPLTP